MPAQARYALLKPFAITSALAVAMLLAHVVFVFSDPDDDEFYKKPSIIRGFVYVFYRTIYRIDRRIFFLDRPSWFGVQSDATQFAIIFVAWWIIISSLALLIIMLRRKVARRF
jgi:hypothetical protein